MKTQALLKLVLLNILLSGPLLLFGAKLSLIFFVGLIAYNIRSYLKFNQQLQTTFEPKPLVRNRPLPLYQNINNILGSKYSGLWEVESYSKPLGQCLSIELPFKPCRFLVHENLLKKLNTEDLKTLSCLLAHEKKLDLPFKLTMASIALKPILKILSFLDETVRFLAGIKSQPIRKRSQVFTILFSPLIRTSIYFFAPSRSKFSSDKQSAEHINNRHKITRLLLKISDYQSSQHEQIPIHYLHLFMVEPLTQMNVYRYFYWQPNLKDRTKKLIGHYPA